MNFENKITYLNTAACGLVDAEVRQAGVALYEAFEKNSSTRSEIWRFQEQERIREAIAAFITAPVRNIAMVPNFTWAMNAIVLALKGKKRKVLLYRHDFPSVVEPFKINQFDITWIDSADGFHLPIDDIRESIQTQAVDIVAISQVQWTSGYNLDIAEIGKLCKEHGVIFIVDATQSLGAMTVEMSRLDADVLIASNYKWMNAGFGTGILYMSDDFLKNYPPVVIGLHSFNHSQGLWTYEQPSVRNYEPGHPNMFGLNLLEAAMQKKNAMGQEQIEQHNLQLTALLLDQLKAFPITLVGDHSLQNRCSIVIIKDDNGLGDWLKQNQIVVTQRGGMLRISMHFHNTKDDLAFLADCLKAFFQKG